MGMSHTAKAIGSLGPRVIMVTQLAGRCSAGKRTGRPSPVRIRLSMSHRHRSDGSLLVSPGRKCSPYLSIGKVLSRRNISGRRRRTCYGSLHRSALLAARSGWAHTRSE